MKRTIQTILILICLLAAILPTAALAAGKGAGSPGGPINGTRSGDTPRGEITVIADSATDLRYTGREQVQRSYTVIGSLVPGDRMEVRFSEDSVIRDCGTLPNRIEEVRFYDRNDTDVTDQYRVSTENGSLTVLPAEVMVYAPGGTVKPGAKLQLSVTDSGLANAGHSLKAEYGIYDKSGKELPNPPTVPGTYTTRIKEAGIWSGKEDVSGNYTISFSEGSLLVTD